MIATDWNTEAGGLDGLGRKPEDMTRLPKATPAHQSLRKWQSLLQMFTSHDQAKASGCTSGTSGAMA